MSTPIDSRHALILLSGLTCGFGHCLAMCGPFAAAVALSARGGPKFLPHAFYNLGRIVTYGILGGAAGAAGSLFGVAARIAPFQKGILVASGIMVSLAGLAAAGWLPARLLPRIPFDAPARFAEKARGLFGAQGAGACFPLGLFLGFLPCGPVYTVLLAAARDGMEAGSGPHGFLRGAATAVLFGIGTVPALFLFGEAARRLGAAMRARLFRASGALLAALGVLYALRGALS